MSGEGVVLSDTKLTSFTLLRLLVGCRFSCLIGAQHRQVSQHFVGRGASLVDFNGAWAW